MWAPFLALWLRFAPVARAKPRAHCPPVVGAHRLNNDFYGSDFCLQSMIPIQAWNDLEFR